MGVDQTTGLFEINFSGAANNLGAYYGNQQGAYLHRQEALRTSGGAMVCSSDRPRVPAMYTPQHIVEPRTCIQKQLKHRINLYQANEVQTQTLPSLVVRGSVHFTVLQRPLGCWWIGCGGCY